MRYIGFMKISHPSLYLDMQYLQCCIKYIFYVLWCIYSIKLWKSETGQAMHMLSWYLKRGSHSSVTLMAPITQQTATCTRDAKEDWSIHLQHSQKSTGEMTAEERRRRRRIRGRIIERTKRRRNVSKSITG